MRPLKVGGNTRKVTDFPLSTVSTAEPDRAWAVKFCKKLVKFGEKKNNFHRIFLTSFSVNPVNYLFSPRSRYSYRKSTYIHGLDCTTSCMTSMHYSCIIPLRQLSLTSLLFLVNLSKRFKTKAVNFCKTIGEMQLNSIFSPLSLHFLHKFSTQLNAVNFSNKCGEFRGDLCKKCDEMR